MFNFIKRLFDSKPKEEEIDSDIEELLNTIHSEGSDKVEDDMRTIVELPEPTICGNKDSKKVILIVDDQDSVFYLYEMDFIEIKHRFDYDVLANYKIVKCSGPEAGFIASKYLFTNQDEIVIAVLDLTLGRMLNLGSGKTFVYDGVDIALEIMDSRPKCKILFCTAHMLDDSNPSLINLINKFNNVTNKNLLNYTFSKNSDRAHYLYKAISEIENLDYTEQLEEV